MQSVTLDYSNGEVALGQNNYPSNKLVALSDGCYELNNASAHIDEFV